MVIFEGRSHEGERECHKSQEVVICNGETNRPENNYWKGIEESIVNEITPRAPRRALK